MAASFQDLRLVQKTVYGDGRQIGHGELADGSAQFSETGTAAVNEYYISHNEYLPLFEFFQDVMLFPSVPADGERISAVPRRPAALTART